MLTHFKRVSGILADFVLDYQRPRKDKVALTSANLGSFLNVNFSRAEVIFEKSL